MPRFRYATENGQIDPIAVIAGIVQTGLYLDFFYVYFTKYISRASLSERGLTTDTQSVTRRKVRITSLILESDLERGPRLPFAAFERLI